jgi:hypothetical protein
MLPDLSRLELEADAVDTGQDLRDAGIRKAERRPRNPKPPKLPKPAGLSGLSGLSRLALDGDPYAGWTDSEDDEDWQAPEELRGLEREDASRMRVAPHRRSPAVAEDVRANQGEAGKLFRAIQAKVLGMWDVMRVWYWCEPDVDKSRLSFAQREDRNRVAQNHAQVVVGILRKHALDPASWVRTAYHSVRGQIHDATMPEASFRQLFDDYVRLRGGTGFLSDFSKTQLGHFTQVEWEVKNQVQAARALAAHAQLLAPLVDAIRAFGFVPEGHADFQVLWRVHPVRHNNSSKWHMDSNDFRMYGDESMLRAAEWTLTGTRAVATTSCLSIDPNQPTDQCGTRVLSGLPALSEKAVDAIVDDMWDARDSLLSYKCGNRDKEKYFSVMFNREVQSATESAIEEYTAFPAMHDYARTAQNRVEEQNRVEALLASAGVETVKMRNGEIGTFNDHQYHASSATPEGHVRLFFVLRGKAEDVKGRPVLFREDARIVDRQGRLARLSFRPV